MFLEPIIPCRGLSMMELTFGNAALAFLPPNSSLFRLSLTMGLGYNAVIACALVP